MIVVTILMVGGFGPGSEATAAGLRNKDGRYLDILFDDKPVLRYMYAYETDTPQRLFETYKPFYHVYDGDRRLTNGPDVQGAYLANQIRYPHHRGIFIGWNRLQLDGQRYDLWHMKGVAQVHQGFEERTARGETATCASTIHWNDPGGEPILVERRSVTAHDLADPTVVLLDFRSDLTAVRGDVSLNGDPEHAGVQYRAHNDVAAGPREDKAVYLFHEDGIDPRKDKDLPWVAMTYGLGDKRYFVQHMNHPANPKDTVYSAYRDYGRFGAFFTHTIEKGATLTLRYRFWIGRGAMPSRDALAARYAAYADPPEVAARDPQATR
jgi:hypothetical protein